MKIHQLFHYTVCLPAASKTLYQCTNLENINMMLDEKEMKRCHYLNAKNYLLWTHIQTGTNITCMRNFCYDILFAIGLFFSVNIICYKTEITDFQTIIRRKKYILWLQHAANIREQRYWPT